MTEQPFIFADKVVKSTSVVVRPQIALPGDAVRMDVSILTSSDDVDETALNSHIVSMRVTRADTGEVTVSAPLSLDAASSPALGKLRYSRTFHAPRLPHVYVVEAVVEDGTDPETIGEAVLSVLTIE